MSITPAFSPGPWITQGACVGSVRRWIFEDLYEQCSFHIAEKMPSSVKVGSRPISLRRRSYSSGLRPWASTSAGVMRGGVTVIIRRALRPPFRREEAGAGRPYSHDILGNGRESSGPQRPLGNRDPLGLGLADVSRRAPHLC